MELPIELTDHELAFIDREVARLQQQGETDLTPDRYLARRLQKLIRGDVDRRRAELRDSNQGAIASFIETLPADHKAATRILAKVGLAMDARGRIRAVEALEA
ncbi:MAG TPA: hypothetical protein VEA16_11185 [Vicinamibacterales bacterium]|nr:hypothetical protein [Vicinamibacterales bacterium]